MTITKADVVDVIERIQYFYKLKYEIRYAQSRHEKDTTESTAEHSWGMSVVATYFLPLEDPDKKWDWERIFELITWHDIDEVETGDVVSFHKSAAMFAAEGEVGLRVVQTAPEPMREHLIELIKEYDAQITPEAKFVKAIDKIEPIFHLMNEKGRATMLGLQTTDKHHEKIRRKYVKNFPTLNLFHDYSLELFYERGHFFTE